MLKSPGHLWALDALLADYPDARVVQTHRDPLKVIASLASLVTLLRSMSSDRIDRGAIGAEWTARLGRRPAAGRSTVRDALAAGTLADLRHALRRLHPRRDRHGAAHLRALRPRAERSMPKNACAASSPPIRTTSTARIATRSRTPASMPTSSASATAPTPTASTSSRAGIGGPRFRAASAPRRSAHRCRHRARALRPLRSAGLAIARNRCRTSRWQELPELCHCRHRRVGASVPPCRRARRRIAILVYDGMQSLDPTGPLEVFATANRFVAHAGGGSGLHHRGDRAAGRHGHRNVRATHRRQTALC